MNADEKLFAVDNINVSAGILKIGLKLFLAVLIWVY
jgi:hypothetical protein